MNKNKNMSPAEQEHYDHVAGSASELQNCFSEAGATRCRLAAVAFGPIANALLAGEFVVVEDAPYHCKATDAFVGVIPTRLASFDTREAAEAHANALSADPSVFDGQVYVLPRAPQHPDDQSQDAGDDNIPF